MSASRLLRMAAARYVLGDLSGDQLKEAAARALDAGAQSASLAELAAMHSPAYAEAGRLFERAIRDRSSILPDADSAFYEVASTLIRSVVESSTPPQNNLAELRSLSWGCKAGDWPLDNRPSQTLLDQIESILKRCRIHYYPTDQIEMELMNRTAIAASERWSRTCGREVVRPEWRTPDVLALARTIDATRSFHDLPILADALEEAGCDDDSILGHCREPGEHSRGCWAIDLLLGKG